VVEEFLPSSATSSSPSAIKFEVHFRNFYPESSVFLAIAYADPVNCHGYGDSVSVGWWKLDYNVDRLVWASTDPKDDAFLYYAQSADGKVKWTSDYNLIWINESAPFRICRNAPPGSTWKHVGTEITFLDPQRPIKRITLEPPR